CCMLNAPVFLKIRFRPASETLFARTSVGHLSGRQLPTGAYLARNASDASRLAADGLERIHVVGACAVLVGLRMDERDSFLLRVECDKVCDLFRVVVADHQRICAEP